MKEPIYTICNVYDFSEREKQLLPHFINHYENTLKLSIIFCVSKSNILFQQYCLENKIDFRTFDSFSNSKIFGPQDSIRINSVKNELGCWYIPVDLDELICFHDNEYILSLRQKCIESKKAYIKGYLVDRLCAKNTIKSHIDPSKPINKQFPNSYFLTRDIMNGCFHKVAMASPDIKVSPGHHWPILNGDKVIHLGLKDTKVPVYHYKWFGDIMRREYSKWKIRSEQNPKIALEQQKLLDYFDAWPARDSD